MKKNLSTEFNLPNPSIEKTPFIYEYIWLDAKNDFRSKTKVIYAEKKPENLPTWNYDGSSTGQAIGTDSEIFLKPSCLFRDPFRDNENSFLVWCETMDRNMNFLKNSNRHLALETFENFKSEEPWFGLEQEYFIMDPKTNLPVGFSPNQNPEPQGKYYCGVGADRAYQRVIPETHLEYCLYAGIKICGLNAEVAPAQWEYQIGPCEGIEAGDHLWVSRYILNRIAESYGFNISYHPKPLGPNADWNGSGCHTNFSTKKMRCENGIITIYDSIKRLAQNHYEHIKNYGEYNEDRMSGKHETSSYYKFTYGRANRGASVRIPNQVLEESKGYFEDRRPAANCDPYLVTNLIMKTVMNPKYDPVDEDEANKYDMFRLGYVI